MMEPLDTDEIPIEKNELEDEIVLGRHTVSRAAYFMLVIFFVITILATKVLDLSWYFQNGLLLGQINSVMFFILSGVALVMTVLMMIKARQHSRDYNANLLAVFEFMKRQGIQQFWYSSRSDKSYGKINYVNLQEVQDIPSEKDEKDTVQLVVSPVEMLHIAPKGWPKPTDYTVDFADIEEIGLPVRGGREEKRRLRKNSTIQKMLSSEKWQLLPFMGAYISVVFSALFFALAL